MKRRLRKQGSRSRRRGASLVELLIAITFGGLVMTLGLGMLHLMLKTDHTLSDSLQRRQTVSQLSRAFRRDVHAARKAELTKGQEKNGPPVLRLQLDANRRVRYWAEDNAILRTETEGEKTIQTNKFRFSQGTKISFQADESAGVGVAIQSPNPSTTRPKPKTEAPLRQLTIQARPGRDHRFAGSSRE